MVFEGEKEFEQKINLWGVSDKVIGSLINSFGVTVDFSTVVSTVSAPLLHLQVIDTSKSTVNMMASKIEVAMKKSEAMSWARLDLPVPAPAAQEKEPEKEADDEDGED